VYNTSPPEQIAHLFSNAGNRVVVTESQFLPRIREVATGASQIAHLVCVDGEAEGAITLGELEAGGDPEFDFDAAWRAVEPTDLATIIYTSGTTGPPKGVEITHRNVTAQAEAIEHLFGLRSGWHILSYLPPAHIADRVTSHYSTMLFGAVTTPLDDPRKLPAALADVRPHLFFGVPRVWEKAKSAIDAGLAGVPLDQLRAVVSGHAHYDHFLDVPHILELAPGARTYTNMSGRNILAALAPDRPDGCMNAPSPVIERQRVIAPRERVIERERVVIAPDNRMVVAPENQVVVQPAESTRVTTGSSTSRSCFIDLNGFERCY